MVPKPFNQAVFWGGLLKGLWAYASYHPTWPLASKAFVPKPFRCFLGLTWEGTEHSFSQLQGDHLIFNYVDFLKSVDVPSEDESVD